MLIVELVLVGGAGNFNPDVIESISITRRGFEIYTYNRGKGRFSVEEISSEKDSDGRKIKSGCLL